MMQGLALQPLTNASLARFYYQMLLADVDDCNAVIYPWFHLTAGFL